MTDLRPYQLRALAEVRAVYRRGGRAICVVMPTGSGKTRLGVEFARGHVVKGGRVLWLAHRVELVSQAADRLKAEGLASVGVIAAEIENPAPDAAVQVASTQTLIARRVKPGASLVVLDEAHHYVAEQWGELADHYAGAIQLGLTATPERSDGKPLGDLFDSIVVGATARELTDLGFLAPCEVIGPRRDRPREIAANPVAAYMEHAHGRRAFVFAATVAHAQEISAEFVAAGIPSACVSAETPADARAEAVDAFRRGELLVLCNVYVFTEGSDIPEAEVCILARGCSCASTYIQMVGRVLRPAPSKASALLIDLPGVSNKHGLPTDDRCYSLEGKRGITLINSGTERSGGGANRPAQIEAALVRITSGRPDGMEKREFLRAAYLSADERGYKSGWAIHRFRERYGHVPWEAAP